MKNVINRVEKFICKYVEESIQININEKHNYELKFEHTMRVRSNMVDLSQRMDFDQNSVQLSELIGLLHDIGRFKQYRDFKSFSDSITGSHATLSVQMIEDYQLLSDLNYSDQNLIKDAIEYHNHYLVPKSVKGKLYTYSTLIRDADKLDAFYLETNEGEKRKYDLGQLHSERNYSPEVIADLKQLRQVDFSNFKYKYDRRLGVLGLIFNLEYLETLEFVKEKRYVEKLIDGIPDSEELREVKNLCLEYIDRQIAVKS